MLSFDEKKETIAMVVPTGIGACIGGFAGDASLTAKMFARDFNVILNPNVVNAACFTGISDNMLYTEGSTLTELFKGNLGLIPSENNKIGIIFDKGIFQGVLNVHINTMNAVKTIYGVNVIGYEITDKPCGVEFFNTQSGVSSGSVLNPETMAEAGRKLIEKGANVLAVVCKFDEAPDDNYQDGEGVDIVGGVEAIISHYLTRTLKVPVVHSPAFEDITITTDIVDPRAAAEYITPTFLPCLLIALKNAPLFSFEKVEQYISRKDVKALIMPYNALGSSIVFNAIKNNIKVYAVRENKSVLNITKENLKCNDIIEVSTYEECYKLLKENLYEKV